MYPNPALIRRLNFERKSVRLKLFILMSHIPKPRKKLQTRTETKKLKPAHKYKRNRYIKYKYISKEVDEIREQIANASYGDCAYIAFERKIPSSTIRTWKSKIRHDPEYSISLGYKRKRRAIFTIEEEEAIADFIRTNIIGQGQIFTDQDFRILAFAAFWEKYMNYEKIPDFKCSNGFIFDFKQRHRFSSRRGHLKRRPVVSDEDLNAWKEKIKNLLKTVPKDHIVNVDETAWFFYPKGLLTWATKGSTDISSTIGGSDKENITALCSITAAGTKLPMMLIAAGKTTLVEASQLGDVYPHWKTHSESGWTTEETFVEYLLHIAEYFNNEEVHLILDVYAAHRTELVKETARNNNITLYFIPPGCTDLVQPLDVKVFGALKATARKLFRERYLGVACPKVTSKDAVQNLIKAWESVSNQLAEDAWDIYEIERPE